MSRCVTGPRCHWRIWRFHPAPFGLASITADAHAIADEPGVARSRRRRPGVALPGVSIEALVVIWSVVSTVCRHGMSCAYCLR